MSELDQLRQEAEQLKNQIRVRGESLWLLGHLGRTRCSERAGLEMALGLAWSSAG